MNRNVAQFLWAGVACFRGQSPVSPRDEGVKARESMAPVTSALTIHCIRNLAQSLWAASLAAGTFVWIAGCGNDHLVLAQNSAPSATTRLQKPAEPEKPATPTPPIAVSKDDEEGKLIPVRHSDNPGAVRVLAWVNGRPILKQEVDDAVRPMIVQLREPERSAREKEIRLKAIEDLIDRELLLHDVLQHVGKTRPQLIEKLKEDAQKEWEKYLSGVQEAAVKAGVKIESKKDLKEFIQANGMDFDFQHAKFEKDHMARTYLNARVVPQILDYVGRQQIYDYYQQHENEFQTEDAVQWQDIFIDAHKFPSRAAAGAHAAQIAAKARSGADFMELVKKHDQGDSSYRNGEGEGRRRGEIRPPELEALLFQMRDGDIGPVVETATGFHVFRLVKRERAGRRKLDDKLQGEIRRKLQNEMMARETRRFIENLKSKASIELSPEVKQLQKSD